MFVIEISYQYFVLLKIITFILLSIYLCTTLFHRKRMIRMISLQCEMSYNERSKTKIAVAYCYINFSLTSFSHFSTIHYVIESLKNKRRMDFKKIFKLETYVILFKGVIR